MDVCILTFKSDFHFFFSECNLSLIKRRNLLKNNLFIVVKIVSYKYSIESYKITMINIHLVRINN